MNVEQFNPEQTRPLSSLSDQVNKTPRLEETERNASLANLEQPNGSNDVNPLSKDVSFTGKLNPAIAAYGLHTLSEMPATKEVIEGCKESFSDSISVLGDKCRDFFGGMYDNIKDFITGSENDGKILEKLGDNFVEQRDFGLDKCSDAAKEIFNPGVIDNWSNLSNDQRKEIAGAYANEVAKAFELENYNGVYFEDLDPGVMGYNNGDGSIHLSNDLIAGWTSPLEIMNTITHELRHQYQSEAIRGYHNVPDDVRQEWAIAEQIYNYDQPYCYDPWGYTYNPLEIDARYSGETVVRNVTHDMFNA